MVRLRTPAARCIVAAHVFDAFGWAESDELEWRRPADRWDATPTLDGSDPARMVFVLRARCDFLPCELARLHAFHLGLEDEQALAPWGIDTATDELFARRVRPGSLLWLAADNLNALFWGLHDWAHFHNHGPFEDRAATELQCDAAALAWLWLNRDHAGLSDDGWEGARQSALSLSRSRFAVEGRPFDASPLAADRVIALVG